MTYPSVSYTTQSVEPLLYGVQAAMAEERLSHLFDRAEVDSYVRDFSRDVVFRLKTEIYAHRQAQETVSDTKTISATASVDVPASTWQMFKQRHESSWWLGWLVRRRPVVAETITKTEQATATLTATWTGYAKFPDMSVRYPDSFGRPIYFSQVDYDTSVHDRIHQWAP